MKRKIITWTFQYEVDDTHLNSLGADTLYTSVQRQIGKLFPEGKQLISYIHKQEKT